MANSHVQGLSLRTQVHVMTLERTNAGINKADRRHEERANRVHRCFAAGIPDYAGQLLSVLVARFARRPCATNILSRPV